MCMGSVYDDIRLRLERSYTSSADIPFSLISSFTLSNHLPLGLPLFLLLCTFISITLRPSYVVLLSSHHVSIPHQPPCLEFLCYSPPPTFVVPLILSFLILSSFVTPRTHRSILISVTSNLFPCAFFNAHIYVSAPYTIAGLTTVLYTFPLIFPFIFLSHNTPYTLFQ